ncbi:MAG: DsbA family protein [Acetobacteraceae bacterium]|nr:DsbA family protein [Acetobacteraceae bacterium]
MRLTRRSLLSVVAATPFVVPRAARAADDPRLGERSVGRADARVVVEEYFSLTCSHCAQFAKMTLPQVKSDLVEKGIVRLVYHDFPLDQIALTAAAVARSLPKERYDAFIGALFASQDRWAFARGVNHSEELWKFAALAGMPRATFDATVADEALKAAILAVQAEASKQYKISSTPCFVIKGEAHAGALSFDRFNLLVIAAQG